MTEPKRGNLLAFEQIFQSPILKKISVFGLSTGLSQVTVMVYAIMMARFLGRQEYGLFASHYALAGMTIIFVNLGMDTWFLREGAVSHQSREYCLAIVFRKILVGILLIAAIAMIFPLVRPDLFSPTLIILCSLDVLSDSIINTFINWMNIEGNTQRASKLLLFVRSGKLILGIALAINSVFGLTYLMLFRWLPGLMAILWILFNLRASWVLSELIANQAGIRNFGAYSMTEILAQIYGQIDVFLLGLLATPKASGEYSPALSVVNSLFIVYNSFFIILVPILSREFQSNLEKFVRITKQTLLFYLVIGLVISGAVAIFSPFTVWVLGSDYVNTASLLLWLTPVLFFKSLSFGCANFLVAVGWQQKRIVPQIISSIANVLFNLALIPVLGPWGSSLTYCVSEILLFGGYGLAVWHKLKKIRGQLTAS